MIIQFEKRIAWLKEQIEFVQARGGQFDHLLMHKFLGALEEAESLYSFYRSQLVDKGRVLPAETGVSSEEKATAFDEGYREG